jgi:hypothetical protein
MTQRDAIGKPSEERFREIRDYFLENLRLYGSSRTSLYDRPKPGDAREPTEEEMVRKWAECFEISVNDIRIGIDRAFSGAAARGVVVTSFRYCVPQIVARVHEVRANRASQIGQGPRVRHEN